MLTMLRAVMIGLCTPSLASPCNAVVLLKVQLSVCSPLSRIWNTTFEPSTAIQKSTSQVPCGQFLSRALGKEMGLALRFGPWLALRFSTCFARKVIVLILKWLYPVKDQCVFDGTIAPPVALMPPSHAVRAFCMVAMVSGPVSWILVDEIKSVSSTKA